MGVQVLKMLRGRRASAVADGLKIVNLALAIFDKMRYNRSGQVRSGQVIYLFSGGSLFSFYFCVLFFSLEVNLNLFSIENVFLSRAPSAVWPVCPKNADEKTAVL
jgi:hypothetical protein